MVHAMMVHTIYWLAVAFLLVFATPALAVEGTWHGKYMCTQGITGVTLMIERRSNRLHGRFCFCAVPENPGLPTGEFELEGQLDQGGTVRLIPKRWILAPPGWLMIPLELSPSADGKSMTGTIGFPGCSRIQLAKAIDSSRRPQCLCSAPLIGSTRDRFWQLREGDHAREHCIGCTAYSGS
jgi:hypothetical protein